MAFPVSRRPKYVARSAAADAAEVGALKSAKSAVRATSRTPRSSAAILDQPLASSMASQKNRRVSCEISPGRQYDEVPYVDESWQPQVSTVDAGTTPCAGALYSPPHHFY